MSTLRFFAVKETLNRVPVKVVEEKRRSELFGQNVYDQTKMRQTLTSDAYKSVANAIEKGSKIDRTIADQIASAQKSMMLFLKPLKIMAL